MTSAGRVGLALGGGVLVAYLNAFSGDFQFDDYAVIVNYRPVHSWLGWFSDLGHGIRPVLKLSYTLNWTSGLGAWGFHLFNVLVHAANTFMVYALACRFLQNCEDPMLAKRPSYAPLLTGMLFALHPIQTEAVTYISGRSASLMALFYLGSVLAYVYGVDSGRRLWRLAISPGLFFLAGATKETALTLPFALLLWDWTAASSTLPRARGTLRRILALQWAHWLILFLIVGYGLLHPRYGVLLFYGFEERGLIENLMSQIHGVTYLVGQLVFPYRMNIDPDLRTVTHWSPVLVFELSCLATMVAVAILAVRKRPWIGFGMLWFFLQLLPTNSLIPRLDIANDRQVYLASAGLFLIAAVEMQRQAFFQKAWGLNAAAIALLLTLTGLTVFRNRAYHDEVSLWEDAARKSPEKPRVFNNLGYAYELTKDADRAAAAYARAIELNPDYALAQKNLKRVRMREALPARNSGG